MEWIYLDYNGTTPLIPEVRQAMEPYWSREFGNPSSQTPLGIRAREAVERARGQVAALIGAAPEEIVFTSGGTESNNTVILGAVLRARPGRNHIVTTEVEHPSVLEPCLEWVHRGGEVTFVKVDGTGRVDPDAVLAAVGPRTLLVSVMHANNETGTIMPVAEIGRRCRERGILFHTDAAQSLGKVDVQVEEMFVDFMTLAGHKLYAPKGIGALYVRKGVEPPRYLFGAGQEGGRRAGTENVMFDVALGAACAAAARDLPVLAPKLRSLRERLAERLRESIPELRVFGHPEERLPNTLYVGFPGVSGRDLLAEVPDIYASTGAACHSDRVHLSHVLAAMGVSPSDGKGAVRLTLGRGNTEEQIHKAAKRLISAFKRLVEKG